ncbi:MAG: site-specific DNA-methyltransferase [Sedimentisphaerales bacterium]|nr:site-specific DNA-methyltransferase [Sedimentisphaerales bacterium]
MPTLDWIGKKAVVNHHREVPYRLLRCDEKLSMGDPGSGNLLVEGDNLLALKALLPYYAGQVKCIYIDPPYNTGNENWIYNDNVNSFEIRKWLGHVVGKEAEDLSRDDKWLCMMYPRLAVLREFLSEDGAIFISIDDNEIHNLRSMMNEIYGKKNFIASIIWQKIFSTKNTARHLSESHDYIVVYSKNANIWRPNLIERSDVANKRYKNPDNDPRGPWTSGDCSARNPYNAGIYSIKCPGGRTISGPPKGMYWRFSKEKFEELDKDKRIWWGKSNNNVPRLKRFLSEVKEGVTPDTIWFHKEVGNTQEAKKELLATVQFDNSASVFISPKPTRLLRRIIEISTNKDSIILDSFAGTGTTGQAVLAANEADGGKRRFICIEMESDICQNITKTRLNTVLTEYKKRTENSGEHKIFDSGFRYCKLAYPIFDKTGQIHSEVTFADLATHVFFTETGEPIPKQPKKKETSPLLGIVNDVAVYFLFNGILGDKRANGGNILTSKVLAELPVHKGPKVIYGEGCRLGISRLKREGIIFKQIPYQISVS